MNLAYISFGVLTILLLLIMALGSIDYWRRRKLNKKPSVSFLLPCYNDGDTVEQTIRSIHSSYDDFELIVVNDKSTDNSASVLEKLRKKYSFRLVTNKRNLGKAQSLNNISRLARHDVLFVIDADTLLNKKAVNDILARLEKKGVAAASSPYKPANSGFLPLMQEIEYNMLSFIQGAYNIWSTISLWGGCFAVKKDAFIKAGRFTLNAIIEDMDLALKLNEKGYRVEQSFVPVLTQVPGTFKGWYKQKIRWTSGGAQCLIRHTRVWLKNPLHIIFTVLFSVLSVIYVVSVIKEITFIDNIIDTFHFIKQGATLLKDFELTGFYYGAILLKNLVSNLYFTVFSVPYVMPMVKKPQELYKFIYLVPFSLVYYPMFTLVSVVGIFTFVKRSGSLKEGKRAW